VPIFEVRSRVPGAAGTDLPTVLLELEQERVVARDLIRRAVEEQVRVLKADPVAYRKRLDRQYRPLPEGASPDKVDPEQEVKRALRAFQRGVFTVFSGGRQVEALDDEVVLRLGEPVVFLRLVPLAGG
jgi:hypothetical protein